MTYTHSHQVPSPSLYEVHEPSSLPLYEMHKKAEGLMKGNMPHFRKKSCLSTESTSSSDDVTVVTAMGGRSPQHNSRSHRTTEKTSVMEFSRSVAQPRCREIRSISYNSSFPSERVGGSRGGGRGGRSWRGDRAGRGERGGRKRQSSVQSTPSAKRGRGRQNQDSVFDALAASHRENRHKLFTSQQSGKTKRDHVIHEIPDSPPHPSSCDPALPPNILVSDPRCQRQLPSPSPSSSSSTTDLNAVEMTFHRLQERDDSESSHSNSEQHREHSKLTSLSPERVNHRRSLSSVTDVSERTRPSIRSHGNRLMGHPQIERPVVDGVASTRERGVVLECIDIDEEDDCQITETTSNYFRRSEERGRDEEREDSPFFPPANVTVSPFSLEMERKLQEFKKNASSLRTTTQTHPEYLRSLSPLSPSSSQPSAQPRDMLDHADLHSVVSETTTYPQTSPRGTKRSLLLEAVNRCTTQHPSLSKPQGHDFVFDSDSPTMSHPPHITPSHLPRVTPSQPLLITPSHPPRVTPSQPLLITPSQPLLITPSHPPRVTPSQPLLITPSHPPHVATLHHEEQSDDYDDFDMSPMKYRNSQQNSKWTESSLLSVRGRGREREEGGRGRGREREEGGRGRGRGREEGGRGRGRGRGREEGGKGKSVFDILESESLEQVKKYPTRSNSSSFYNKEPSSAGCFLYGRKQVEAARKKTNASLQSNLKGLITPQVKSGKTLISLQQKQRQQQQQADPSSNRSTRIPKRHVHPPRRVPSLPSVEEPLLKIESARIGLLTEFDVCNFRLSPNEVSMKLVAKETNLPITLSLQDISEWKMNLGEPPCCIMIKLFPGMAKKMASKLMTKFQLDGSSFLNTESKHRCERYWLLRVGQNIDPGTVVSLNEFVDRLENREDHSLPLHTDKEMSASEVEEFLSALDQQPPVPLFSSRPVETHSGKPDLTPTSSLSDPSQPVMNFRRRSSRIRNKGLGVGSLEQWLCEDEEREEVIATPRGDPKKIILTYKPEGTRVNIEISEFDLDCLQPSTYLNDRVIDFYLMYLWYNVLADSLRDSVHVFSSFFHQRLIDSSRDSNKGLSTPEKVHDRVRSWTRHVDLFSKDYIILPVCDKSHWFVAFICHPGHFKPSPPSPPKPHPLRKRVLRNTRARARQNKMQEQKSVAVTAETPEGTINLISPATAKKIHVWEEGGGGKEEEGEREEEECPIGYSTEDTEGVGEGAESEDAGHAHNLQCSNNVGEGAESENAGHAHNLQCSSDEEDALLGISGTEREQVTAEDVEMGCEREEEDEGVSDGGSQSMDTGEGEEAAERGGGDREEEGEKQREQEKKPCVIVLDSLGITRRAIISRINSYLTMEWQSKRRDLPQMTFKLKTVHPKLLLQNNSCDCGVFLLQYVESLIHCIQDGRPPPSRPVDWASYSQTQQKRKRLKTLISQLGEGQNPAKSSSPPSPDFTDIPLDLPPT